MMQGVSRGFRQLAAGELVVLNWSAGTGSGRILEAPTSFDEWVQGIGVEVETSFGFQSEAALTRLGLGDGAQLAVQTLWHSPGTKIRGASLPAPLEAGEVRTSVAVPGHAIRGSLRIEHVAFLLKPGASPSEFAPVRVGSIVWSSSVSAIRLEGVAPRLPILPTRFSRSLEIDSEAALWWLRLQSAELDSDATASLWLWLNVENYRVKQMLDNPESEAGRTLSAMMGVDVARQLVLHAIRDDDFNIESVYPEGSLGFVLQALVRLVSSDVHSLRTSLRDAPGELDARIQARTADVFS